MKQLFLVVAITGLPLLGIFGLTMTVFPRHALAQERAGVVQDLPALSKAFGKGGTEADYVIVVDRSKSMKKFWDAIQSATADFIGTIPDNDYVSLILFDGRATSPLTPRKVTAETRKTFADEIRRIAAPQGDDTDLGVAARKTLEELNRPGANRLQFVFMFTDFVHEPPANSRWFRPDCSAPSWKELTDSRVRLLGNDQHVVKFFALGLPLSRLAGRDLSLVSCVFEDVESVSVADRSAISAWFERRKAEFARERLRIQVEKELRQGRLELKMAPGGLTLGRTGSKIWNGTLRSTFKALSVRARLSAPAAQGNASVTADVPPGTGELVLAPGESRPVSLRLTSAGGRAAILPTCAVVMWNRDVEIEAEVQPPKELQVLNIAPERRWSQTVSAPVEVCGGFPWWLLVLVAILALGAVAIALYRAYLYFRPAYLEGVLQDERRSVGSPPVKRVFLRKEKRNEVSIGSRGTDIVLSGGPEAVIKLVARRKPRRSSVVGVSGYVRVDGNICPVGSSLPLRRGRSTIEVCGYLFRWK